MSPSFSLGQQLDDLTQDCGAVLSGSDKDQALQEIKKVRFDYVQALTEHKLSSIDHLSARVAEIKKTFQI